jgi:major membrane immunogen (membrane-anchored lipoprotein)
MKDIDLSMKKKLIIFASLGLAFWGAVAWLFISVPIFIIDLLPPFLPLTIFTFLLFLIGLILLTIVTMFIVRSISPRYTWGVILISASIIVLYNLSPLAPSWNCWGKRLYVLTVKAGQTCTTICTNNKKKPCGGWSDCWGGKNISCSAAGKDQDGRNCNGCCFSCDVVCEDDDPPPPSYNPPTVSGSVACSQAGNNGWCIGASTLNLSASDPQGFALTISGTINGTAFTCSAGNTCSRALPEGSGPITYKATAATSGLSSSTGSTTWKRDVTAPVVNAVYPSANGSNGWHVTSPVAVSASGSDALSGLASALVSVNGGAWQSSASLTDGIYTVNFRTFDNAGNSITISRTIQVDATLPSLTPSVSGTMGANEWYVSNVVVDADATDALSGIASVVVSDNGGAPRPVPVTLTSGTHAVVITATDVAGNSRSTSHNLTIDTDGPIITTSIIGTEGDDDWYVSEVDVTATVSDPISGTDGTLEILVDGISTNDLPIHLTEGDHTVVLRATDDAGNVTTTTLTIHVDTTPPSVSTSTAGTKGNAGWYISDATTTITASDSTSDIDRIEYKQNSATWQSGTSVLSTDGVNAISVRVYDQAGNLATDSLELKVDTVDPIITPHVPTPTGLDDWFVSVPIEISATGSDATSGLLSALVSMNGGEWKSSQSLTDGVYATNFRSEDVAGNMSNIFMNLKIDATKPTLAISTDGTIGTNGWYTSQTTTTFKADDKTSGVDRVEYSQNDAGWQTGTSVLSKDGINSISAKTYDKAGNTLSNQMQVKVDTGMPSSTFTSPANGSDDTLARNVLSLAGTSTDALSGIATVELSYDGGKTWIAVVPSTDGKWTYDFDTTRVQDGIYTIVVRTVDMAGNTVVRDGNSDSGAHITVIINNAPPHIKLTPEWFIWDSGELVIKTEYFPLESGTLTISDPQRRWPKVEIPFDEKYPSTIIWDRRFANGVLAPIGNYHVDVKACNTYNLCSNKTAIIKIPWISVIMPTASPVTPTVAPEKPVAENIPERSETQIPPVVVVEDSSPQIQIPSSVERKPVGIALSLVAFIALIWAVASAALSDRRPVAINAITKTIQQKRNI